MSVMRLLVCGAACALTGACDANTDARLPPGPVLADAVSIGAGHFSEWSAPVNLGPVVNSRFADRAPELSPDGLSLYFASNRPGGFGATDIYVARRVGPDQPWGPPANLGAVINTPGIDAPGHLSRDGHRLYFTSSRAGGFGSNDIWVSWRANPNDDFAWETPVNLGSEVNSAGFEGGITLRLPELYVASDRVAPGGPLDIFVSVLGHGGTFGPAVLVEELSSEGNRRSASTAVSCSCHPIARAAPVVRRTSGSRRVRRSAPRGPPPSTWGRRSTRRPTRHSRVYRPMGGHFCSRPIVPAAAARTTCT